VRARRSEEQKVSGVRIKGGVEWLPDT